MKENEIPFGAFDSELQGFEYTIPDGYTAEIVDGKVIVKKEESEDEKIRGELIRFIKGIVISNVTEEQRCMWIAWLEKQEKQGEYKSAWSEEDEKNALDIKCLILNYRIGNGEYDLCSWIDHLKERVQTQPKQGEQKPNFCHHEVDFSNCSEEYRKAYYDGWNNCNQQHEQMKNLQKPTWSDYDEERYLSCLQRLRTSNLEQPETINTVWLKSLRDRITLTNKNDFDRGYDVGMSAAKFNQWRPTREQLGALIDVLLACENPKTYTLLNSLYNDLKKL